MPQSKNTYSCHNFPKFWIFQDAGEEGETPAESNLPSSSKATSIRNTSQQTKEKGKKDEFDQDDDDDDYDDDKEEKSDDDPSFQADEASDGSEEEPEQRSEQLLQCQKVPPDDNGRKIKKRHWERNFEQKWWKGVCRSRCLFGRGILMHKSGRILGTKWGICRSAMQENENCRQSQRLSIQNFFIFITMNAELI